MARAWLSDEELEELTDRVTPAAQARVLEAMKVPYRQRPDGSLVVGRVALDNALAGVVHPQGGAPAPESNGLNWN